MRYQQKNQKNSECGGFTLVELAAVIGIAGVLFTALIVNWSSFINHQDLRKDANALHKDLLAMKATALANGDKVVLKYAENASVCTLEIYAENAAGAPTVQRRPINFHKTVKIKAGSCGTNNWDGSVVISPDHVNAYTSGCVEFSGRSSKKYRIIREDGDMKPRLQISADSTTWANL